MKIKHAECDVCKFQKGTEEWQMVMCDCCWLSPMKWYGFEPIFDVKPREKEVKT